ncbi:MAG: hypothetical protein GC161_03155 [Planctomycetaceae bacterium]|nr:hypothetical protein [Planctomycetaceae bacterium]
MGVAARWSLFLAAGLAVGYLLLRSGQADRFLPEVAAVLDLELGSPGDGGAGALAAAGELPLPGPSWARVRAGASSGAARIEPWPTAPAASTAAASPPDEEGQLDEPLGELEELPTALAPEVGAAGAPDAAVRRRVEAGLTLSEILYEHYGRQGPKLASAVARYNGLSSPDKVRAGSELELPSLEVLAPLMR